MNYIVGIGEYKVIQSPGDSLVTYSLGSCIGVTVFDPKINIGGLVHCMMPLSRTDPDKARQSPAVFTDTGVSQLIGDVLEAGGRKEHLQIKVAGGARMMDPNQLFRIGERNLTVLRKILWKNNLMLAGEATGGDCARTMIFTLNEGRTVVLSDGTETLI